MPTAAADVKAIALLDEPVRRTLFDWVVGQGRAVSRDEAAAGSGVSRALAAFHLDRLVAAGLLVAEFRRLSGRTGPGAGRPAKLYRRGPREVSISVPERRYETPARLFAATIERLSGSLPPEALREVAHDLGEAAGSRARTAAGKRPSRQRLRGALLTELEGRGYQPSETAAGDIRLGNCPYDSLVDDHRDVVCGMNLALAGGLLDGLREERDHARLDPQPGQCCVVIETTRTRGRGSDRTGRGRRTGLR